ncbi:MAG: pseudouridine synthase [Lachnospiraceae bacterium]|nr:pseudouridine synthase [Lachnospiraceae bacterium]
MNEEIGMGNAMENAPRKREGIRLNKYLSEAGVCSRREADEAVEAGEVLIDGHVAVLGDRILEGQIVTFKGQDVSHNEPEVLIAFNKPRGVVCTAEKKEPDNIVDYINYPVRIYPVGRLDKESRGLILLTNQGNLVNKLNRGGNFHEKEYIVRVDHEVNDAFLRRMMGGVYLNELHVKTRPCKAWKSDENEFHIILTQGLNRQIRRMCEALGYRVRDLKRVRIMDILLRDLPEGSYRDLTEEEKTKLIESLKNSYSDPKAGSDGRRPGHDRRGYGRKPSDRDGRKPYGNRDGRKPYGNRDGQRSFSNHDGQRPYGNRNGQRSFSNHDGQRPYGNRDGQRPYGNRNNNHGGYGNNAFGFRKNENKDESGSED